MSLFQCDNCGCLENTALGWYHSRFNKRLTSEQDLGKALCSVCAPTTFPSGERTKFNGEWHNIFTRRFFEKGMYHTNDVGSLAHKDTGELASDLKGSLGGSTVSIPTDIEVKKLRSEVDTLRSEVDNLKHIVLEILRNRPEN